MFVLGFGISLDVEGLRFAALDRDQSPESRAYIQNIAGSRYLHRTAADCRRRRSRPAHDKWRTGAGHRHSGQFRSRPAAQPLAGNRRLDRWRHALSRRNRAWLCARPAPCLRPATDPRIDRHDHRYPVNIVSRYRYNQDFKSIYAMVPAVIPILLIFIPAILMALGVVREKELGSITNLYVTPVTRLEFLLGKQLPYIVVALISFVLLVIQSQLMFHVPIKGSLLALSFGAVLYVIATTGFGLLISTFTSTQIAALFGTAILTICPPSAFPG
jgi:ribosome-dependent ATPase